MLNYIKPGGAFAKLRSKLIDIQRTRLPKKQNLYKILKQKITENYGSVLIEFAFCVPVLIVLLFFINDHYRFYELRNKVKNSAYMMANMIQNICNSGSVQQIGEEQIKQIAFASGLNLFNNNAMFKPYPHGVAFAGKIVYVKRKGADSYYSHTYTFTTETDTAATAPLADRVKCEVSKPKTLTTAEVTALDSSLVCDRDGEEKALIQVSYEPTEENKADSASNERKVAAIASGGKSILPKISLAARKLGLILLPAKSGNFTYAMAINPKPGAFGEIKVERRYFGKIIIYYPKENNYPIYNSDEVLKHFERAGFIDVFKDVETAKTILMLYDPEDHPYESSCFNLLADLDSIDFEYLSSLGYTTYRTSNRLDDNQVLNNNSIGVTKEQYIEQACFAKVFEFLERAQNDYSIIEETRDQIVGNVHITGEAREIAMEFGDIEGYMIMGDDDYRYTEWGSFFYRIYHYLWGRRDDLPTTEDCANLSSHLAEFIPYLKNEAEDKWNDLEQQYN